MPSPSDVAQLRSANGELAARVQRDLTQFWGSLDLSKPERARDELLRFVPSLTTVYGDAAALVAADWYDAMRAVEDVASRYAAQQAETFAQEWVEDRVRYGARHLFTDDPDQMLKFLDGAVQEYALQPGRDTIARAAIRDPDALGWRRAARSGACEFCHMLARRGSVYRAATVRFVAHGKCSCVPVPAWAKGAPAVFEGVQVPPAQAPRQPVGTVKAPPAAQAAPTAQGPLPAPEPAFVERLAGLLRSGKVTPAQLRQQTVDASPLGQSNVAAAIERYTAARSTGRRDFTSAQEAREWANAEWAGPSGYAPHELAALRSYTGSGYGPMNNTLRSSKGKRTNKNIQAMDDAIERAARVPDDITVVRNANLRQLGITGSRQDPRTAIGQEFVDYGYLSTSVNRRGAMQGEVRMEITVPKGARGVYVSGDGGRKGPNIISDYGGGESELILGRGSRLVITSVKKSGKRWHVVADLIQDGVNG